MPTSTHSSAGLRIQSILSKPGSGIVVMLVLFVIVMAEIAKKFRCREQMLRNLGTISYTCTAPLRLPSRDI